LYDFGWRICHSEHNGVTTWIVEYVIPSLSRNFRFGLL